MKTSFMGYRRPDGCVGVRNLVAVLSAMDNTNPTAENIARSVYGTIPLSTPFGRTQIGRDFEITLKTLAGIGRHPNIAAVLILSLSLESATRLASLIRSSRKKVEVLGLQECGGTTALLSQGIKIAAQLVLESSELNRESCLFSDLIIGVECGGSDTTSGIVSNPVIGIFADKFIDEGGTIILSEPAEFMGAEHLLSERAIRDQDRKRILEMVKWFEDEAKRSGVDMRGINPTPDNISGGLSTIEEKSLGAITKGGSRPVVETIEYSDSPTQKGLVIMNTPSAACESMTGLVGGGAQIIVFSTGRGNSIGAPVAATLKVTGNPNTVKQMPENIDLDLSDVITLNTPLNMAADRLWQDIVKVASGKLTCCEVLHEQQLSVSRFGPSV